MKKHDTKRLADFLYEIGTMRKLARMHRQTFLTDDMTDNISSHSYRVTMIGWLLAKMEEIDPYKTVMMCLLHDLGEVRSNDHNWVHKRYTKVYEDEIINDQLGDLPFAELKELALEYEARKTPTAIVAKDADILDQILLLREYAHQGNKEAELWLYYGNNKPGKGKKKTPIQLQNLKTTSAKKLGQALYQENPSDWWKDIWTNINR